MLLLLLLLEGMIRFKFLDNTMVLSKPSRHHIYSLSYDQAIEEGVWNPIHVLQVELFSIIV